MVHIVDEGSVFEAPIGSIWNYLDTPEEHGPAHKSSRNSQVKPLGPNSIELSQEQNIGGEWHKVVNHITVFPPVGMVIEVIEGPLAGSKLFTYYTPKGHETGVTVVGEFTSKVIPPDHIKPGVMKFLEDVFNDDNAALKEFARKG